MTAPGDRARRVVAHATPPGDPPDGARRSRDDGTAEAAPLIASARVVRAAATVLHASRCPGSKRGGDVDADDRRARFRELHERRELFVMPNPWDVGSARLLASLGFPALATTSAGFAWSLGKLDQRVSRDELVAHVASLAEATPLPLNVDSERCYPDDPGGVAETVAMLAQAGAAGFSIEDYDPATGRIDDVGLAADRVALAAEAAHRS